MSKIEYEKTGKKVNKDTASNASKYSANKIDTRTLVSTLVRRHKFGLVSFYAIALTIYLFLPFLPGEIINVISSI